MDTASALARNATGSHVYNLGFCLRVAVLFLQASRGSDLILVALAGRVGNVITLRQPRS